MTKVLQTPDIQGFDQFRQEIILWISVENAVDTVDKSVENSDNAGMCFWIGEENQTFSTG